jgi:hypothetical protein
MADARLINDVLSGHATAHRNAPAGTFWYWDGITKERVNRTKSLIVKKRVIVQNPVKSHGGYLRP